MEKLSKDTAVSKTTERRKWDSKVKRRNVREKKHGSKCHYNNTKMFSSNWKPEPYENPERADWGEPTLSHRMIVKGILEGFPFSKSRAQRLRQAGISVSHWATAEHATPLPIFFWSGLYCYLLLSFLYNFTNICLWLNLQATCHKVQESFFLQTTQNLSMWQLHGWGSVVSAGGKGSNTLEKKREVQLWESWLTIIPSNPM